MSITPASQQLLDAVANEDWAGWSQAIARGAHPEAHDLSGHNALMLAVLHGHLEMAAATLGWCLTKAAPSPDAWLKQENLGGKNVLALCAASRPGAKFLLAVLLPALGEQAESWVLRPSETEGASLIHHAAAQDAPRLVTDLVRAYPRCLEQMDGKGRTPLGIALKQDHLDVVDALLKLGARVEGGAEPAWSLVASSPAARRLAEVWDWSKGRMPGTEETVLHVVIARSSAVDRLLKTLLALWPEGVRVADAQGKTPLHLELGLRAHAPIVNTLTKHGALWSVANHEGETPEAVLQRRAAAGELDADADQVRLWLVEAAQQKLELALPEGEGAARPRF